MAWYPGMQGGTALGRLLFGDVNFSGKLPVTWDTTVSDWPTFAGDSNSSAETKMEYWVGYQYFDHNGTTLTPSQGSFPFGYGLSYTTFSYQNLQVPCSTVRRTARSTSPSTCTTRARSLGRRRSSCSSNFPGRRSATGPAPATRS